MWANKLILLADGLPLATEGQCLEKEGELRNASGTLNYQLSYGKEITLTLINI